MILARTIEVPDAFVVGIALGVLLLLGILAGCLLDLLPGRAFYSRRAFEPPVRTWTDQQEWEPPPPWTAPQPMGPPPRATLLRPGRELERGDW